jgi:steroid delta-isomerase-like uncharacterized protein
MEAKRMSNENILRSFFDCVWNGKDYAAVPGFVAAEYAIHLDAGDPWEGKTLDHAAFLERLHFSFDSFPDMRFEIQSTVADGDAVGVSWIMTGTNLGEIAGFPATGKAIKTAGMTLYRFKDGKVCGHSQVFDRATVIRQLGFG